MSIRSCHAHRQTVRRPWVYRDTVIVPPALEEGFVPSSMHNTPGYVMAFDAHSGKRNGVSHHPKDGEFGAETWEASQPRYRQHRRVGANLGRSELAMLICR